jgi:hypothetical protein
MAFSLSRWRASHLLIAWGVYWLGLIAVTLRPALVGALRAVSAPEGHGNISAGFANSAFTLTIASDTVHWVGSASFMSIALWIAGPPLLLWLLWLVTRRAPVAAREPERDYRIS